MWHFFKSRSAPAVGKINFGDLRRVTPVNSKFGFERGNCIDRYYIEKFLSANKSDIKGHVLEIGHPEYARKFGAGATSKVDVLNVAEGNPVATIVMDIEKAAQVYPNTFDCVIFTQTMHLIFNMQPAAQALFNILKPGGVLLASFPGISQISRYDMDRWGDNWRFTTMSVKQLFEKDFPSHTLEIESHGNVLTSVAFLHGLVVEELTKEELEYHDPDYQMIITLRIKKLGNG